MTRLGIVVLIALVAAAAVAMALAEQAGRDRIETFAQVLALTLIGAAITVGVSRREGPSEGLGRVLLYAAIWLGAIGVVTLIVTTFS